MEIKGNQPIDPMRVREQAERLAPAAQPTEGRGRVARDDGVGVDLSRGSRELKDAHAKAFTIARETSPVREDRVAELKAKIESGQYEIDSGKIADGMLREAVKDRLAST